MDAFDAHAHLNLPDFADDLPQVLERAREAGVGSMLCVGLDLPTSRRAVELARLHPGTVFAAVGIHPNHWGESSADMDAVANLACEPGVVAVGETGLDFHHDHTPHQCQAEGLREHLRLGRSVGQPVIIHARRSDDAVLRVLQAEAGLSGGVRHCFDRPAPVAERFLALGFHISLAAAVTRRGYKRLKAAVGGIPADRLLVETDCPYQSPASRAGQRNEPAFIRETIEAAARLRRTTPRELAAQTTANARTLFLPKGPQG